MFFSRAIQWYHSHADPVWPEGTLKALAAHLIEGPRVDLFDPCW